MKNKNYDNDLFFTCSIIEYIARFTKNKRSYIVNTLGAKGIDFIYEYADVLHCENIDAVMDELITDYKILEGNFDNVEACAIEGYRIPTFWDIGKVYMRLVLALGGMDTNRLIDIYNSYISECIDDYTIGFYFSSPDCIFESYKVSEMLG